MLLDKWSSRCPLATQVEMSHRQVVLARDVHSGRGMRSPGSWRGGGSEDQKWSPEGLQHEEVGEEKGEKQEGGLRKSIRRGRGKAGERGIPETNEETKSRKKEMGQVKCC